MRATGLFEATRRDHLSEPGQDTGIDGVGLGVSQAAQFAVGGDTAGGIVAHSLALAPTMASRGRFELVRETWHAPLRQRMALLKGATDDGVLFYTYLQGPTARAVMRRHGFMLPGE